MKGVHHSLDLKTSVTPVCDPGKRSSRKEEAVEMQAMQKLVWLGVLEMVVPPWATSNFFVRKKDGGIRVTSDFRRLNDLTITDSYPMENTRDTLEWQASKRIFSVFDSKDGFIQVEYQPSSKDCTAMRTILDLFQYKRLP